MTSMASKVLNVVHSAGVVGALSMVGYHCYQIGSNVTAGIKHKAMESTYFEDVQKKVDEEYDTKYGKTDKRDWYDKDDKSFLENVPRGGAKPKSSD